MYLYITENKSAQFRLIFNMLFRRRRGPFISNSSLYMYLCLLRVPFNAIICGNRKLMMHGCLLHLLCLYIVDGRLTPPPTVVPTVPAVRNVSGKYLLLKYQCFNIPFYLKRIVIYMWVYMWHWLLLLLLLLSTKRTPKPQIHYKTQLPGINNKHLSL